MRKIAQWARVLFSLAVQAKSNKVSTLLLLSVCMVFVHELSRGLILSLGAHSPTLYLFMRVSAHKSGANKRKTHTQAKSAFPIELIHLSPWQNVLEMAHTHTVHWSQFKIDPERLRNVVVFRLKNNDDDEPATEWLEFDVLTFVPIPHPHILTMTTIKNVLGYNTQNARKTSTLQHTHREHNGEQKGKNRRKNFVYVYR